MPSEIPQLEVITAISDADFEDFVAQLLFSQGWSIVFRAFDTKMLSEVLQERQGLRTVIIYKSDLPGFTSDLLMEYEAEPVTFIQLDGTEQAAHAIMQRVRSQLRLPLVHGGSATSSHGGPIPVSESAVAKAAKERMALPNILTVTGSSGSPGRSNFVIALAQTMAADPHSSTVKVIDADLRSQTLLRRISQTAKTAKADRRVSVTSLELSERPTELARWEGSETMIIDLGVMPSISEVVNDRRWQGTLVNNILDRTTHLLYVVKSNQSSLDELSHFLKEIPVLVKKLPITFICILTGSSRQLREAESRFLTLTTGENRYLLRENHITPSDEGLTSTLLSGQSRAKREIGKIAKALV